MASMALSLSLYSPLLPSAVTLQASLSHKISFRAPQSIRRRSYIAQMAKMMDGEEINHPKVFRPLVKSPPSLWGDTFANITLDTELREKYSIDVAELKEQVRSMLLMEECKVSEKIIIIDTLERLGVAYHFEDDIEDILQQLFDNYDSNEDYDLYNDSLQFRIFRQHGHKMSCDIFTKYRGSGGKLQDTLENDAVGMLSLYEAANLAIHGDDILDEALVFTKTHLRNMIPKLSSYFAEEVKRSLDICLHRRLPRVEARNYIETYGRNPLRNETLLSFAKVDFNLVQMLHRQELSTLTRWDANANHLMPDYLKILYKSLLDLHEECEHQFMGQGRHRGLSSLKEETQILLRGYYKEAKWWFNKEEKMPSFDEYWANGLITSLFFLSTPSSIFGLEEAITKEEVFDWLQSKPKIAISIITIWRLIDDIETYETEKTKGQAVTGIECYMKQYGVSKEDTIKEFNNMIEKAWKDLNEECLKPTPFPKRIMDLLINSARAMVVFFYRNDAYTYPHLTLKDPMISLLVNPIPLV